MASIKLPFSHFCVFCYKNYSPQIADDKTESLILFTKLLGRYLEDQQLEEYFEFKSATSSSTCTIGCCLDCSSQTEQFSDIFHQHKMLELKLQWQIIKLVNIIKLANKVPSRISQLKKAIEESQVVEDQKHNNNECNQLNRVQVFRKRFTKKCRKKLANSQPRVFLTAKAFELKPSKQNTLEQEKIACPIEQITNVTLPAINSEKNTEPGKDINIIDVSQVHNENLVKACQQHPTSIDDLLITTVEDLDPICGKNKLIINKKEVISCSNNDFSTRLDCEDDFVSRENTSEGDTSEPVSGENNIVIECSPHAFLIEETLQDAQSLPDCDEDPLYNDNNDESDNMEYNDGGGSEFVNSTLVTSAENVVSPADQLSEIITIESTFSCQPYFKTEFNANYPQSVESESPERTIFVSDTIISNRDVPEISTETIHDNLTLNKLNLGQNFNTICSTILQEQQTACLNEEPITNVDEIEHETITQDNEDSNINIIDETEPQQRYNLRRKRVTNVSLQLEEKSSDNDSDQEYSDQNASSSSSDHSSGDFESEKVTQTTSGIKRNTCKRKQKFGNRSRSSSIEPETKTCPDGCAKVFQNEQKYENHLKLHASGEFPCNFCQIVLTTVIDLSTHEYTDHCPNDFNIDKQKQCPRCFLKFDFPFEYEEHFAFVHFGIGDSPTKNISDKNLSANLWCGLEGCTKKFQNDKLYWDHRKLHLEGKYPCNFCKIVATSLINLANHERTYHCQKNSTNKGKEIQCPRCLLKFKYSFDYEDHFAYTHYGIGENPQTKPKRRRVGQPRKGMGNNRKRKLFDNRKSSTTTSNAFYCHLDGCEKIFRNEKIYSDHRKLHSNGKFPCNFCKFVATTVINLANHEHRKHGQSKTNPRNEKQCPRCLLKFKYSFDYEDHFAFTYFGIGENPETKEQRRGKGQPRNDSTHCPNEVQNVPVITCKICNRKMPKTYETSHMKKWHNTKTESKIKPCKFEGCQAYFLTDKQLLSHSKSHREEITTFCCNICKTTFSGKLLLRRHLRQQHNESVPQDVGSEHQPDQLPCNFCDFTTNVPRTLAIHEEKEHVPETEDDLGINSNKRRCPRCPYKYDIQSFYIIHHLSKHLGLLSINSLNACKLCSGPNSFVLNSNHHYNNCHNTNLLDDSSKILKCDVQNCPAYFLRPSQLYTHKTKMHPILDCLKCVKTFKTRSKLLHHLSLCQKSYAVENHPNLSVSCDNPTCAKMFHNQEEMKMHTKYAHPKNPKVPKEKNEICPKCGKAFISIGRLKLHLKRGHDDHMFVCVDCGKAFKYKQVLDKHMIFHKGPEAWEYQCTECGKKCATKQKLEQHLRTHSKETPFVCQFCGGKYAHRHNWRNHLKSKHGDEDGIDEIVGNGKKGQYMSRKGSKKGDCIMTSSKT